MYEQAASDSASQLEVMVLDDEEIVCARLKPLLEKWGYRAETYTDSIVALERIHEHRFDIIITDLKMANVDGMQLYTEVKERWPDTDVIIITGFATVEIARKSLQAGVRDIIAKPFKINYLKGVLNQIADEKTSLPDVGEEEIFPAG